VCHLRALNGTPTNLVTGRDPRPGADVSARCADCPRVVMTRRPAAVPRRVRSVAHVLMYCLSWASSRHFKGLRLRWLGRRESGTSRGLQSFARTRGP
jgi:hypothetical protein